jgi:alpha-methylacyl-CoA racemase
MIASGFFTNGRAPERGATVLNGSVPHYNVYQCSDSKWISLGSLEPHFWVNLCKALGCEEFIPHQYDSAKRDEIFAHFRQQFATKTRDEWFAILKQTDICVAPVLGLDEAMENEHNLARNMVIDVEGVRQIGIGPKLSETPGAVRSLSPTTGQHTDEVLASLGYDAAAIASLREKRAIA